MSEQGSTEKTRGDEVSTGSWYTVKAGHKMGEQRKTSRRGVTSVKSGIRHSKKPGRARSDKGKSHGEIKRKASPVGPGKTKASRARLERLKKKNDIAQNLIHRLQGLNLEEVEEPEELRKSSRGVVGPAVPTSKSTLVSQKVNYVTINRLARELKKQLRMQSTQISPMTLRNGKTKHAEV